MHNNMETHTIRDTVNYSELRLIIFCCSAPRNSSEVAVGTERCYTAVSCEVGSQSVKCPSSQLRLR